MSYTFIAVAFKAFAFFKFLVDLARTSLFFEEPDYNIKALERLLTFKEELI